MGIYINSVKDYKVKTESSVIDSLQAKIDSLKKETIVIPARLDSIYLSKLLDSLIAGLKPKIKKIPVEDTLKIKALEDRLEHYKKLNQDLNDSLNVFVIIADSILEIQSKNINQDNLPIFQARAWITYLGFPLNEFQVYWDNWVERPNIINTMTYQEPKWKFLTGIGIGYQSDKNVLFDIESVYLRRKWGISATVNTENSIYLNGLFKIGEAK